MGPGRRADSGGAAVTKLQKKTKKKTRPRLGPWPGSVDQAVILGWHLKVAQAKLHHRLDAVTAHLNELRRSQRLFLQASMLGRSRRHTLVQQLRELRLTLRILDTQLMLKVPRESDPRGVALAVFLGDSYVVRRTPTNDKRDVFDHYEAIPLAQVVAETCRDRQTSVEWEFLQERLEDELFDRRLEQLKQLRQVQLLSAAVDGRTH
jgi:hypothetical protein